MKRDTPLNKHNNQLSARISMNKNDFILISIILAITAILFFACNLFKTDGSYVTVRIDGEQVAKYSLSENGEYELNGGTNVLRIEDGAAYIVSANCPDHLCIKQGRIEQNRETLTCLPNRLTVTVYSSEKIDVDLVG